MIAPQHHYNSFHEAYPRIVGDIITNGTEVSPRQGQAIGSTLEIPVYQFSIPATRPLARWEARKPSIAFMFMEPIYLFTNQDRTDIVSALSRYAPNLKNLALNQMTGKFDGNYGDRLSLDGFMDGSTRKSRHQMRRCYELLSKDIYSRRAILTVHNPVWDVVNGDSKDIPCTLSMQFLFREEALHMICTMRSNDIWYGTPHNVMMFTFLQRAMAGWLGVPVGNYIHRVGSMHMYKDHADKAHDFYVSSRTDKSELKLPKEITYPNHPNIEETFERMDHIITWHEGIMKGDSLTTLHPDDRYEKVLFDAVLKHKDSLAKKSKIGHNKATLPTDHHDNSPLTLPT